MKTSTLSYTKTSWVPAFAGMTAKNKYAGKQELLIMARTVEDIEKEIARLPQDQLKKFRAWYEKFDADKWDAQIETDVADGKLDALAEKAIADHNAGKSKKL